MPFALLGLCWLSGYRSSCWRSADPGEKQDIAAGNEALVAQLWAQLNMSILTQRDCSAVGDKKGSEGIGGCSPTAMLGSCDADCAAKYWKTHFDESCGGKGCGPICGVPGC